MCLVNISIENGGRAWETDSTSRETRLRLQ